MLKADTPALHIDFGNANPNHLANLDDILDTLNVPTGTKLGHVDQAIDAAKVDEGAKAGNARDFALAPLAHDQAGKRFTPSALSLFAGDIRSARSTAARCCAGGTCGWSVRVA